MVMNGDDTGRSTAATGLGDEPAAVPATVDGAVAVDALVCASCGEEAPPGTTWCEACGHELSTEPKPACVSCGEREVDPDEGYCLSCGYRQPRERDHVRLDEGPVVAVSDRGRRHHDNEDAVAIGTVAPVIDVRDGHRDGGAGPSGESPVAVLVVCDGVSSTAGSAEASSRAAQAACDALLVGLSDPGAVEGAEAATVGGDPATPAGPMALAPLFERAVEAAQGEAAGAADDPTAPDTKPDDGGSPSSTLVSVVVRPLPGGTVELSTAWVGDSRAYWVGPDEALRLTGDDHELQGGLIRWLGADSVDPTPDLARAVVGGPGHLVVCTDGLWRYVAEPAELAALLRRLVEEGRSGVGLAEALVSHANQQGGHDNITVALWSSDHEVATGDGPPPPDTSETSEREATP